MEEQVETNDTIHFESKSSNTANINNNETTKDNDSNNNDNNDNNNNNINDDDDEFGDFDDYAGHTFQDTSIVEPMHTPNTKEAVVPCLDVLWPNTRDKTHEQRIRDIQESLGYAPEEKEEGMSNRSTFNTIIHDAWGVDDITQYTAPEASQTSDTDSTAHRGSCSSVSLVTEGQSSTLHPHASLSHYAWTREWTQAVEAGGYTQRMYIYRKSSIRRYFVSTLYATPVNPLSPPLFDATHENGGTSSGNTGGGTSGGMEGPGVEGFSVPVSGSYDNMDLREADLLEAKRLCDISEDEIRKHTQQEIHDYVTTLLSFHAKMQAQANYWLDAREQLMMDAEMHHKMIASLVQFAQQQQVGPKGNQSTTKKKRFGSFSK